jgi:hypothetical protein
VPLPTDNSGKGVPEAVQGRLQEIIRRLKRSEGGLSREADTLWIIRQLTDLISELFTELYRQKDERYGKPMRRK